MTTERRVLMEEIQRLTRIVAVYETAIDKLPEMIEDLKREMENDN